MRRRLLIAAPVAALLTVLALPSFTHGSTRTGSDLGSRVATLESQIATLQALLEHVGRRGDDLIISSGLCVEGSGNLGPNGQHIACFENTDGGTADGVAIKIGRAPCYSENNFLTFYNEDEYVCGRVEGFALLEGDPLTNFPSVPSIGIDDFFEFCPAFITFSGGSLPSLSGGRLPSFSCSGGSLVPPELPDCSVDFGALPSLDPGSLPSIDFKSPLTITNPLDATGDVVSWLADVICWAFENDMQSLIQTDPFGLALAPLILAEAILCKNGTTGEGGVTYGSTGADYAEWLEKLDASERLAPGQIVGVHGGKITKRTAGAEKVMAVSLAPVIAGNMPQAADADRYQKVGFMGQVPVYVRGPVKPGDYVVASGKADGVGVAVAPGALTVEQVPMIVGRAWSASDAAGLSAVNVVIGVGPAACAEICARQADELSALEAELEALLAAPRAAAPAEGGAR